MRGAGDGLAGQSERGLAAPGRLLPLLPPRLLFCGFLPSAPPASASARHVCPAGKQAASSVPRSWGGVAGSKSPAWDGPPHASPCHTVGVRPPEGWPAPADGAARSPPPLRPAGPLLHGARVRVQACGVRACVCACVRTCAGVAEGGAPGNLAPCVWLSPMVPSRPLYPSSSGALGSVWAGACFGGFSFRNLEKRKQGCFVLSWPWK